MSMFCLATIYRQREISYKRLLYDISLCLYMVAKQNIDIGALTILQPALDKQGYQIHLVYLISLFVQGWQ